MQSPLPPPFFSNMVFIKNSSISREGWFSLEAGEDWGGKAGEDWGGREAGRWPPLEFSNNAVIDAAAENVHCLIKWLLGSEKKLSHSITGACIVECADNSGKNRVTA